MNQGRSKSRREKSTGKGKAKVECWDCGNKGHYRRDCYANVGKRGKGRGIRSRIPLTW